MTGTISRNEFEDRLIAICIGGSSGLPRRLRDRHIILASATLWMAPGAVYTEPEINEGLSRWLDSGCPSLDLDVTTLRRELVDHRYLDRDDSGSHYSAGSGPAEWRFEDIADVDPSDVTARAREEREARKSAYVSEPIDTDSAQGPLDDGK